MKIICADEEEADAVSRLLVLVCNELKRSPKLDPEVQYSYAQGILLMRDAVVVEEPKEDTI
jgi:hypothetical protein